MKHLLIICLLTLTACAGPGRLTTIDRSGATSTVVMDDCNITGVTMVCEDADGYGYLIGPGITAVYESDWRLMFRGPAPEIVNPCATPHAEWMLCP